jgi:hypothetical protein
MCWSEGHEAAEGVRLWLTPLLIKRSRLSSKGWAAFRLVRGWMVGLGGVEPPTSSLSAIEGSPLCNSAFLQVAHDRQWPSNALFERVPKGR